MNVTFEIYATVSCVCGEEVALKLPPEANVSDEARADSLAQCLESRGWSADGDCTRCEAEHAKQMSVEDQIKEGKL